jgi:hypothetical protein
MQKINIFKTAISGIYGIDSQYKSIADFLIKNRSQIRIPVTDTNEIMKTRTLATTKISKLYDGLINSHKQNVFTLLNIPSGISTPEIFTMNHILLDIKQLKDANSAIHKTICSLPEYENKIILNITPYLKRKIENVVTDMPKVQSLFVKGLLVRSYYNSIDWLTPSLIKYLSKSYSMTISTNIARNYNLDYNDQQIISTILTTYFHTKCYGDTRGDFPVTIKDCTELGSRIDIVDRLETMKEYLNGDTDMTIESICELIRKMGPERMNTFDTRMFYTINQRLGSDHVSTLMSLEYPPYWAHEVLLALSGIKSGLYIAMKNQMRGKLIKEGEEFGDTLTRTSKFMDSIEDI